LNLTRANDQVRQMSELVDALLILRRVDAGSDSELDAITPVKLGDLARDASRELLERIPHRSGDLRIEAEDEVLVAGHATLILSAVRNLLSNALKFTRDGEAVVTTVTARDGLGVVVVEDSGLGVAPEDRERIFDPFFRSAEARASRDGFGLGLPVLRRVARAHGGDVVVSSSPLGGARFEMSLPLWRVGPLTDAEPRDGVRT
jgi:signal transduction histidine kinase